jgi:hypothetical protein
LEKQYRQAGNKKASPQAGFSVSDADITLLEQQPKQQPMQPKQQRKQPKQRSKQQQLRRLPAKQRSKQQQLRQLEQQQLVLVQQLQELRLVLEQLLLFSSKQPEQQPAGTRSAGIFSLVFLS